MKPYPIGTKFLYKGKRHAGVPSGRYTATSSTGVTDDVTGRNYAWGSLVEDMDLWDIFDPKEDEFDKLYKRMTNG